MKYGSIVLAVWALFINGANCKKNVIEIDGSCKVHEFKCNNGQCIDDELLCDGKAHCTDKSDETKHICSTIACPVFAYTCKYGACIHRENRCNGVNDCADNSDESHCSERSKIHGLGLHRPVSPMYPSLTEVKKKLICQSGELIDEELMCDGKPDCSDHSDETQKLCSNFYCPYFTFRCDYGACISLNKKCNGVKDCKDGSDEERCFSSSTLKPEVTTTTKPMKRSFQCLSGETIDEECLCDGEPDCADQSDETLKECSRIHCPSFAYKCDYGACVLAGAKCNGIKECADNSDETSCSPSLQTLTVLTERFKCNSGQMTDTEMVCDGKADCKDSSDEMLSMCSHINCPRFSYRCSYGACVHGTARCNGFTECVDNSDEVFCPVRNSTTSKDNELSQDYLVFS